MSKQVFQQKTEEFICYIVMNMIKIVVGLHLKNVTMAVVTVVCIVLYVQMRNDYEEWNLSHKRR